jgi:aryl-alcohol dehydrogenase-like predicted oxidoreductase
MRYKLFGSSGLRVSELCLGTMTFGEDGGVGASKEESFQIFERFAQAGGNFIDTANMYTNGTSEKFLGEFLKGRRDEFVVATKYSGSLRKGDPNAGGNHRKSLVQSINRSLQQLDTDYIDLLWVHMWDGSTPVEEIMRSLNSLVQTGKVLHIAVSDWPAWLVAQAQTIAKSHGWTPFEALQIEYSLVQRAPERDLLPMARAFQLSVTPWSILGGGLLSGKYSTEEDLKKLAERRSEMFFELSPEKMFAIVHEVADIANEVGRTSSQVALNWVRQQGCVPILGVSKASQLDDNLAALEWLLSEEHLSRLNAISSISLGFPHDFLRSKPVRNFFYGGTHEHIDWQPCIPSIHINNQNINDQ